MSVTNDLVTIIAGDHRVLRFDVVDGDNNNEPLDLTGLVVRWSLAKRPGSAPTFNPPIVAKTSDESGDFAITAISGRVDVTLKTADTENKTGTYEQQLTLIDADGEEYVVATGRVELKPAVP